MFCPVCTNLSHIKYTLLHKRGAKIDAFDGGRQTELLHCVRNGQMGAVTPCAIMAHL